MDRLSRIGGGYFITRKPSSDTRAWMHENFHEYLNWYSMARPTTNPSDGDPSDTSLPNPSDTNVLIRLSGEEVKSYNRPVFLVQGGVREVEPGVYSALPKKLLKYFGIVDLTGSNLSLKASDVNVGRQYYYVESRKYDRFIETYDQPVYKNLGPISFVDKDELILLLQGMSDTEKVKALNLKYLTSSTKETVPELKELTKKQLQYGNKIFLYRIAIEVLDQQTLEIKPAELICLAFTTSIDRFINGTATSENVYNALTEVLDGGALRYLDPKQYKQDIADNIVNLTQYHDGLAKLLGDALGEYVYYNAVEDTISGNEFFTNKEFSVIQNLSQIQTSPEYRHVELITKQLEKAQARIEDLTASVRNLSQDKQSAEERINYLFQQIEELKSNIVDCENQIKTRSADLNKGTAAVEVIKQKLGGARQKLKRLGEELSKQNTIEVDWFGNLMESGIIIQEVICSKGDDTFQLKDLPEKLADPDVRIEQITFLTTDPIEIHVDKKLNPDLKVLAGPIQVHVVGGYNPEVRVRPASNASIIGLKSYDDGMLGMIWVPHTEEVKCDPRDPAQIKTAFQTWRTGCKGDITATLYYAFEQKDPLQIVFATMAWLTHANTEDQWGAQYLFFPQPSETKETTSSPPEEVEVQAEENPFGIDDVYF